MFLKSRLSIMMFLQYAIWGAWAPIVGLDLTNKGFTGLQVGEVYSTLPLASMITAFLGGQIADRWLPSQVLIGFCHLGGAWALWQASSAQDFHSVYFWMLAWSLFYAPTLNLTNSLTFEHLENNDRDFPWIRTMGTLGWIGAGSFLTLWRTKQWTVVPGHLDSLALAAAGSLALGIFSFALPHTPPAKEGRNPWAIMDAVNLVLKSKSLIFFFILLTVATSEFQFFYVLSAPFLSSVGVTENLIPITKTVSQAFEILALGLFLPMALPRLGVRRCLLIGLAAWPLRYLIFALQKPLWLVIASLGLHGFGFAFFFIVASMYLDRVSPRDIRASVQSLTGFATWGLGMFLGSYFCGWIKDRFTDSTGVTSWSPVFMVPAAITIACALAHSLWFREEKAAT